MKKDQQITINSYKEQFPLTKEYQTKSASLKVYWSDSYKEKYPFLVAIWIGRRANPRYFIQYETKKAMTDFIDKIDDQYLSHEKSKIPGNASDFFPLKMSSAIHGVTTKLTLIST